MGDGWKGSKAFQGMLKILKPSLIELYESLLRGFQGVLVRFCGIYEVYVGFNGFKRLFPGKLKELSGCFREDSL